MFKQNINCWFNNNMKCCMAVDFWRVFSSIPRRQSLIISIQEQWPHNHTRPPALSWPQQGRGFSKTGSTVSFSPPANPPPTHTRTLRQGDLRKTYPCTELTDWQDNCHSGSQCGASFPPAAVMAVYHLYLQTVWGFSVWMLHKREMFGPDFFLFFFCFFCFAFLEEFKWCHGDI